MVTLTFSCLFSPTVIFCVLNVVIGTIFITSRLKHHNRGDQHQQFSGQHMVNSPPQLVRTTSFLDRVKSFNFSSYLSDQPGPLHSAAQYADPHEQEQKVEEMTDVHEDRVAMRRTKSQTSYMEAPAARMEESASKKAVVVEEEERKQEEVVVVDSRESATMERRKGRLTGTTAPFWEDEAVDEKADDFINRFRQQLKLQRMDSILRYKEMLNRAVGR